MENKNIIDIIKDIIENDSPETIMPQVLQETLDRMIHKKSFRNIEKNHLTEVPTLEIRKDELGNEYMCYEDGNMNAIKILKDEIEYTQINGIKIKEKTLMQELETTIKRRILGLIVGSERENMQKESLKELNEKQENLRKLVEQQKMSPDAFFRESGKLLKEYEEKCQKAKTDAKEKYELEKYGKESDLGARVDSIYNEKDWIEIILNEFKNKIADTIDIKVETAQKVGPKRGKRKKPSRIKEEKEEFSLENRLNGLKKIISSSNKINVNDGQYTCFFKKIKEEESDGYIVVMEPKECDGNATKIGYLSEEQYNNIRRDIENKEQLKEIEIVAEYIKRTLENGEGTERVNHRRYGEWLAITYYYITGNNKLPKEIQEIVGEKFANIYPQRYLKQANKTLKGEKTR